MSFLSMKFLLFLALVIAGYYLLPRRFQWVWLLIFSGLFYLSAGPKAILFMAVTVTTTFLAGLLLEREEAALKRSLKPAGGQPPEKEEKARLKGRTKSRKKLLVFLTLLVNFGILAWLKYRNFAVDNVNQLLGTDYPSVPLLLPLGISFYTFQSMGYLIDVYRSKYAAERNLFRFALFVSFFPQILQGPIGRYDRLAGQLYEQHAFCPDHLRRGLLLMAWGYFKKIVIADRAAVIVLEVFGNYQEYHGLVTAAAVLAYSIQLYGDFSGGMDVVTGAAQCLSISLDQNFSRPYFARSISDFWHRWHITLGTWMKDYIFYPFSLSKGMNRFGKYCKHHLGRHVGKVLPVCLANLLVFLVVGVWHGAAWKYIVYGLYNGLIIAFSNLLAPVYDNLKIRLKLSDQKPWWCAFQIFRTFLLVNVSWYFDMATDLKAAFAMMGNTVTGFSLSQLTDGSLLALGLDKKDYVVLLLSCLIWGTVSLLQERKIKVREVILSRPLVVRWALCLLLLFSIPLLGQITLTGGGFIYAQF